VFSLNLNTRRGPYRELARGQIAHLTLPTSRPGFPILGQCRPKTAIPTAHNLCQPRLAEISHQVE
jgi:hypothetical protein